ncbi:MAG: GGDEF domain-containing protein, partial [Candidatus Sericytochromatia bacterium]|nr:GGDEF domain-containing protein [Candidatus Sericytochromatia bacterium]
MAFSRKEQETRERILSDRRAVLLAQMQVRFDTAEKEHQIAMLTAEQARTRLLAETERQRVWILALAVVAGGLVFLLTLRWLQRVRRERAHYRNLSRIDGLTGLYNHSGVRVPADEAYARCCDAGLPFSVVVADVDHFKRIND